MHAHLEHVSSEAQAKLLKTTCLPEVVTGRAVPGLPPRIAACTALVPGRAPVPGRPPLLPGRAKPVAGRPAPLMGRTAGLLAPLLLACACMRGFLLAGAAALLRAAPYGHASNQGGCARSAARARSPPPRWSRAAPARCPAARPVPRCSHPSGCRPRPAHVGYVWCLWCVRAAWSSMQAAACSQACARDAAYMRACMRARRRPPSPLLLSLCHRSSF